VLERVVSEHVCIRESRLHRADITLFPQEEAAVAGVADKRRREFTTVRACARDALAALGLPAAPIVPATGAPRPGPLGWSGHSLPPATVPRSPSCCQGYTHRQRSAAES